MPEQVSEATVSYRSSEPLPPRVEAALADFRDRLLDLLPNQIRQLILYGSYARGEARADSDVDVLVVVDWDDPQQPGGYYLGKASDPRWRQIIDAAVDAMIVHGPFISALVIGESLFNSGLPVAQTAKREGRILWSSRRS